jgi:hypothetical protein
MFPHTSLEPRDDPAFLAVVDRILLRLVRRLRPQDVYLVHIDNWFGPKWLRYSGKGVVAFPYGYTQNIVVALDDHYQDQLTFPPFTRNRVIGQYHFPRFPSGDYEEQAPAHLVHRRRYRWKEQTLHRRVADFSESGLFVWYSSGSAATRRASLLVYVVHRGTADAWYAGFSERRGWQLDQVKGTSREAVSALMAPESLDDSGTAWPPV